ncbi:hypothetical protein DPMN_030016 [Dreissena polymorpha]|uniref:Uncharacterized protein n=1 Tax=Dreissena polymorpha TaxID=45954 RepID=A0A9D4RGR3_DREPO|nr:hypothetical protein DPMN_030016 [Dreissena polymorpha]
MGPGGATVPSGLFPVPSWLFPVPRRSMPVLHGNYRFIPQVLNILILTRWSVEPQLSPVVPGSSLSSPVHPGRAPVHPGRSRITHRGSTGIIVRVGLKTVYAHFNVHRSIGNILV